ncbi:hypothetical protein [Ornithobacterium rhinotracheale]|uniref:hypothetical protein n=3 Tax=Ornithobacterium rhinotracheale TaxID=28251 RepID=UPI0004F665F8|nr:hypothetical protein [Ornithobacterium rhinotracheale]AIQ00288.1 hypothetical protein Q785_01570 [Ornithobacterium rhinotracheale ORT-UMN 88]KGB67844.1 hypothetical protein Q787_01540 [Ornithobacterium rhinotracheale H06-030791]MBN3662219.1 hypothetical protein [Ornithobacterium rhinotracheale]MCK0194837.1 hypothetical protein [Ornithobacterium rhinotracheale]MCK0200696.1 hypothetical protein [Ornithobacterium rhinotracheale]
MKTKILFFSLFIGLFVLTTACNNDDDPKPPTELIGQWKCLGFGNTNGEFRAIEPTERAEVIYILHFKNDFTLSSATSTNSIWGKYNTYDSQTIKILLASTNVAEFEDGGKYIKSLYDADHYSFTKKGNLQLFYSDTEYLLFNPLKLK